MHNEIEIDRKREEKGFEETNIFTKVSMYYFI